MAQPGALARWPAAVSPLTADALQAEPRRARVLAALPTAVYLHLPERHEAVLPVLAADALLLPTGLRLGQPAAAVRWGVEQGDEVVVGGGVVHLPRAELVAVRAWRPARVAAPARPLPAGALASAREVVGAATAGAVLRELAGDLVAAALAPGADGSPTAPTGQGVVRRVRGLVGAGRGLTPSGDDALCGVLLGLRAAGAPASALQQVGGAVRHGLRATTSLSASLLRAAADGYAVPEVAVLVRAVPRGEVAELHHALPGVLAIGHSSGADLLAGLAGTLDALSQHTPHPQPEGLRRA